MDKLPELRRQQADAIDWLVSVYDSTACGWGWLAHIPPNEQNTAEVVVALVKHAEDLDPHRPMIVRCVREQLIGSRAAVTKDWVWVAYALLTVRAAGLYPDESALDEAIEHALCQVDQLWAAEEGGWPDSHGEPCQITWTALALILLGEHLVADKVRAAVRFLERAQNADGGWGLWHMSEAEIERQFQTHPRLIARASSQVMSNPASTALATLALAALPMGSGRAARRGADWLLGHALDTGGWPIFQQIGLRRGETYTYRHFSTAWAIRALLAVDQNYIYHETVISAIMYLINLQDVATSGWRSSEDVDPFTWATCNALDAVADISACLLMRTPNMFLVISQWHQTRYLRDVATVDSLGGHFVFNRTTSSAVGWLVTVLVAGAIALLVRMPTVFQLTFTSMLCLIAGVPWAFHLKGTRNLEWNEAIGIVYGVVGLIVGILLTVGTVTKI